MKAFSLAFSSAIVIEFLIFWSLGIWLCSPTKSERHIVKLRLSSAYLPIPNKKAKKTPQISLPKSPLITPVVNATPKKLKAKADTKKPKKSSKKVIKTKKRTPRKVVVKKTVFVKKKTIKIRPAKKQKEFNPYKNIVTKKTVSVKTKKVMLPKHSLRKTSKYPNEKKSIPTPQNDQNIAKNKLYLSKVAQLLAKRKRYPRLARKRGIEGRIIVSFGIDASGKAFAINILQGSNRILIKSATRLIKNCKLPTPPSSWVSQTIIKLPISYKLRD